MRVEEIIKYDPSFVIKYAASDDVAIKEVSGLASLKKLSDTKICFIKNIMFLKRYFASIEMQKAGNLGIIICDKLFNKIGPTELEELKSKAMFVATVANIDVAISYLSRPFYLEQASKSNPLVESKDAKIDPTAKIAPGVFLGENIEIGAKSEVYPGVVILAGSKIGASTVIFPNVTIYQNVIIGKNCRIHSGVIIGSDGFGYNFSEGIHHKVWHLGGVVIGDSVEIGANSTIDRGTFDDTEIGDGCKIDNLVQIAHNCQVGKGVVLCGQSGLAGSSSVGDFSVFGGRAALGPDRSVGSGCQVAGAALITSNLPDGAVVAGHPARPLNEWLKGVAYLRRESMKVRPND